MLKLIIYSLIYVALYIFNFLLFKCTIKTCLVYSFYVKLNIKGIYLYSIVLYLYYL